MGLRPGVFNHVRESPRTWGTRPAVKLPGETADQRHNQREFICSGLNRGQAAHLSVLEREVLAAPGYGIAGEAPDPGAQRDYVARRQKPQIANHLAVTQHSYSNGKRQRDPRQQRKAQ